MAPNKITFYVDVVSPFAYVAYYILRNDPVFKDVEITFSPAFLGGIMIATGNTPPIKIKNKDIYIGKERNRWAKAFNVPCKTENPPNFPPMTLYAQRVLTALTIVDPDQETFCKAVDKLYEELWTKHTDISKPEIYEKIIASAVGEEKTKKAVALAAKEGKALLLKYTEQAVKDGAFGLPWFVCTNSKGETETFWGVDHFGQVVQFLGIEQPKKSPGWKSVL